MRTKGSWCRAVTWNFLLASATVDKRTGRAVLFQAALSEVADDHAGALRVPKTSSVLVRAT